MCYLLGQSFKYSLSISTLQSSNIYTLGLVWQVRRHDEFQTASIQSCAPLKLVANQKLNGPMKHYYTHQCGGEEMNSYLSKALVQS